MNLGTAQVIRANSRHLPLADNSVDLVVTSPPYFALRSYQDGGSHYAGQIGDEPTPAEFVDSLLEVTRECVRVLKPSGSLWVNLGDKYSGAQAQNFKGGPRGQFEASKTWAQTNPRNTGIPNKSLMGIPWRYALRCIDDLGLILRAEVIWSKPNGLPESVTDRVRRSHEQWFHFTLSPRYFSAVDEIREEAQQNRPQASRAAALAAHHGIGEEHRQALLARGLGDQGRSAATQSGTGKNTADVLRLAAEADAALGSYTREFTMTSQSLGKLPGSVWSVPTEPLKVPANLGIDHFAAFPTEWPKRIISGWSPTGICTACGEGRRPVVATNLGVKERDTPAYSATAGVNGSARHGKGASTLGSRGPSASIAAYVCACTPVIWQEVEERDERNGTRTWRRVERLDLEWVNPAPTTPAVVLDPFGGTGATAMVAKALGRHGISVDMSADYCRLATWRTNDRDQLAKVLGIAKAEVPADPDQLDLFGESA